MVIVFALNVRILIHGVLEPQQHNTDMVYVDALKRGLVREAAGVRLQILTPEPYSQLLSSVI